MIFQPFGMIRNLELLSRIIDGEKTGIVGFWPRKVFRSSTRVLLASQAFERSSERVQLSVYIFIYVS